MSCSKKGWSLQVFVNFASRSALGVFKFPSVCNDWGRIWLYFSISTSEETVILRSVSLLDLHTHVEMLSLSQWHRLHSSLFPSLVWWYRWVKKIWLIFLVHELFFLILLSCETAIPELQLLIHIRLPVLLTSVLNGHPLVFRWILRYEVFVSHPFRTVVFSPLRLNKQ